MTAVVIWVSAVIDRRYNLTSRANRRAIAKSRQPERRTIRVRCEVEKIVSRIKKFRHVVARARATATSEIAVWSHTGTITSGHVVRDKVDNRFQIVRMKPLEQELKFLQAIAGVLRVIGADVEIILDRVWA